MRQPRRDRTILLLLARLGLRAAEVVRMTLDDIDWEAGELAIHGKGGREDKLPLPRDVSQSLANYRKRIRPQCAGRSVFIRSKATHRGFSDSAAVHIVVQRALKRAALNPPTRGAHLFRHGLATRMLHRGASLTEIGQIFDRRPIEYLIRSETEALLSAPDRTAWGGRRDYVLLLVAAQTGLRIIDRSSP